MPFSNPVRETIEAGEVAFGASTVTGSPIMLDVYGELGLDFVWLDLEHAGPPATDARTLEAFRRAASAADVELLVRIESGEPHLVRKVLDAGIRTILVPRVETADDVREAVEAARFSIDGGIGDRGVGTSLASHWGDRPEGYTAHEDGAVLVGVMLENETALGNVEEILAVPELGYGWIGPTDLSISLGHPLEQDHPAVQAAIDDFRAAFHDAGIPVGIGAGYAGGIEPALDDGYGLVTLGSEVGATRSVVGDALGTAHDLAGR